MLWRNKNFRAKNWWKGSDVVDLLIVHRQFRLSRVRHPEPFAKSKRGKQRRAARLFRVEEKLSHMEGDFDVELETSQQKSLVGGGCQ